MLFSWKASHSPLIPIEGSSVENYAKWAHALCSLSIVFHLTLHYCQMINLVLRVVRLTQVEQVVSIGHAQYWCTYVCLSVSFQASQQYIKTDLTYVLNSCTFVFLPISLVPHPIFSAVCRKPVWLYLILLYVLSCSTFFVQQRTQVLSYLLHLLITYFYPLVVSGRYSSQIHLEVIFFYF